MFELDALFAEPDQSDERPATHARQAPDIKGFAPKLRYKIVTFTMRSGAVGGTNDRSNEC